MAHRRYWVAGVNALKTELETGLTFSRVALNSKDNANKRARNTANARKAYDTAQDWAAKLALTPADSKEVAAGFERLKANLAKLEKPQSG